MLQQIIQTPERQPDLIYKLKSTSRVFLIVKKLFHVLPADDRCFHDLLSVENHFSVVTNY